VTGSCGHGGDNLKTESPEVEKKAGLKVRINVTVRMDPQRGAEGV